MDFENLFRDRQTFSHFQKIGFQKRHGISLPLFSLRTKNSLGIGQYLDLLPLIDFICSLKMNIIQLLPLNDCGKDPSPYSAQSSCALNPDYLSLEKLPYINEYPSLLSEIEKFSPINEKPFVDWKKIKEFKHTFLLKYFDLVFDKIKDKGNYHSYLNQNPWLIEYAVYRTLKAQFKEKHWADFPKEYQTVTKEDIDTLVKLNRSEIDFHLFVQFLCHEQLSMVKEYADQKGVLLKGDIPILLNGDSADVYFHQHLFIRNLNAGAPPDFYNSQGQNWHFPFFDWEEARKTHFNWWKRRLLSQSDYFHCYRIDHVVGFFRIWSIAKGKTALEGKFIPRNLYLWPAQGKELLEMMINTSSMLPLAEDLGTVPDYTFRTLKELGVLGTRVLRWQKYYEEDGSFLPLDAYEPISMTTLSTHDAEPTKLWWEKYPEEAKAFAKFLDIPYKKKLGFDSHLKILQASHQTSSFFHINPLQEYTSLFEELTYKDLEKERINTPGVHANTNWCYRTRGYLEDLREHKGLKEAISSYL